MARFDDFEHERKGTLFAFWDTAGSTPGREVKQPGPAQYAAVTWSGGDVRVIYFTHFTNPETKRDISPPAEQPGSQPVNDVIKGADFVVIHHPGKGTRDDLTAESLQKLVGVKAKSAKAKVIDDILNLVATQRKNPPRRAILRLKLDRTAGTDGGPPPAAPASAGPSEPPAAVPAQPIGCPKKTGSAHAEIVNERLEMPGPSGIGDAGREVTQPAGGQEEDLTREEARAAAALAWDLWKTSDYSGDPPRFHMAMQRARNIVGARRRRRPGEPEC